MISEDVSRSHCYYLVMGMTMTCRCLLQSKSIIETQLDSVNKTSRRFALVTAKLWRTAARNDGDSYFRIVARAISDSHCVSQARSKIHDVTNFAKTAFINLSAAARTRRPFDQSLSKTWMVVSTRLIWYRMKVGSGQIRNPNKSHNTFLRFLFFELY